MHVRIAVVDVAVVGDVGVEDVARHVVDEGIGEDVGDIAGGGAEHADGLKVAHGRCAEVACAFFFAGVGPVLIKVEIETARDADGL